MRSRLIIDSIVQQTTILVAELATAAGIRAPLSHVANQIFLELSRAIEAQGVPRKVAADMFGLALRSYQLKVQRLEESATSRENSLWEAIYEEICTEDGGDGFNDDNLNYDYLDFSPRPVIIDGAEPGQVAEHPVELVAGPEEVTLLQTNISDSRFSVSNLPASLLPDESKEFLIHFEPTDLYEVEATIQIIYEASGALYHSVLDVTANPSCLRSPEEISFYDMEINEMKSHTFLIENCSQLATIDLLSLSVTLETDPALGTFTVEELPTLPFPLTAGSFFEIEVSLTRHQDFFIEGLLTIETSQFSSVTLIQLIGEGEPLNDADGEEG